MPERSDRHRRRPERPGRLGATAVVLAAGAAAVAGPLAAGPAAASHLQLTAFCAGVDHPPFEEDRPPGGASYLVGGFRVDAPADMVDLELMGPGGSVQADAAVAPDGLGTFVLPLQQYGEHELVGTEGGHELFREQVDVGPGEPTCSEADLAAPDGGSSATAEPAVFGDPSGSLADVLGALDILALPDPFEAFHPDPPGDLIFSDPSQPAGGGGPTIDLRGAGGFLLPADAGPSDVFAPGGDLACGGTDPLVVCPDETYRSGDDAPGPGSMALFLQTTDPIGDRPTLREFAFAVETNADASDDWMPQGPYAWDGFQGTDRWYWLRSDGAGTWSFEVVQQPAYAPIPSAARMVVNGDAVVLLVPEDELGLATGWRGYSFEHDGSYAPEASGMDVTGTDPTEPLLAMPTSTISVTEDAPTTAPDEAATAVDEEPVAATADPTTVAEDAVLATDEGDPLGVAMIAAGILALGAGGLVTIRSRRRTTVADALAEDAEGFEEFVERIEAEEAEDATTGEERPPPDAGDNFMAAFIGAFGTPPKEVEGRPDHLSDVDWKVAIHQEKQLQDRLEREAGELLERVRTSLRDYAAATERYQEAFVRILSGSTELQGLVTQWKEAQAVAQKQDLAFAIVQLATGGTTLAYKGARWLNAPTHVPWSRAARAARESSTTATAATATGGASTAARAADAATDATGAGDAAFDLEAARRHAAAVYGAQDEAADIALRRLADEAGVDLAQTIDRLGDAEEAGKHIIALLARRRGWHGINPAAEDVLTRLLVNGRGALGGRVAQLSPADLELLRQWSSRPGFWDDLATAATWLDDAGTAAGLRYTADDIDFLRFLATSDEVAGLPGAVEDLTRTVLLGGADDATLLLGGADDATLLLGGADDATLLLDGAGDITRILDDPLSLGGLDDTLLLADPLAPTVHWRPLTQADDAATALTRIIGPEADAPTLVLRTDAAAPDLFGPEFWRLFRSEATTPTVLLNADDATTILGAPLRGLLEAGDAAAPTLLLRGDDAGDVFGPAFWRALTPDEAPTVMLHGQDAATAATRILGDAATDATLILRPDGATAPTVIFGPGATAPTTIFGPGATAPTVILHGDDLVDAARPLVATEEASTTTLLWPGSGPPVLTGTDDAATAVTRIFGPGATAPTTLLGANATAPTVILRGEDATRVLADGTGEATILLTRDTASAPRLLHQGDRAATSATRLLGPQAGRPTVLLAGEGAAGPMGAAVEAQLPLRVMLHGAQGAAAATHLLGDHPGGATVVLDPSSASSPSTLLRGGDGSPVVLLQGDGVAASWQASDPAVLVGHDIGAPSMVLHGCGTPTVAFGAPSAIDLALPVATGAVDPLPAAAGPGERLGDGDAPTLLGRLTPPAIQLRGRPATGPSLEVHRWARASLGLLRPATRPPSTLRDHAYAVGIDVDVTLVERRGGDPAATMRAIVEEVADRHGWHDLPPDLGRTVDHLLRVGRRAVAGDDVEVPADALAELDALAARPGAWSWLATSAIVTGDGVVLPYGEHDIALLRALHEADGDPERVRERLGPLACIALTVANDHAPTGARP